jgi:orotidine-5'-phosphate decarboxylase
VTVHPYLGLAALAPLITMAGQTGRGVIVVTRSSNPEGRPIQEAITHSGVSVEETLLAEISGWNGSPAIPVGTVGAVIGATLPKSDFPLSQLGGVILAPGLGAQGAQLGDIADRFGSCTPGTVVASTSRSLLAAGPNPAELRRAAGDLAGQLAAVLG